MTWILGSGVTFGYGALVSDVRAVWPDGSHLDVVQKISPVGGWLMAGFAGSVEIGFAMIEDMRAAFGPPVEGIAWMPKVAAWRWHRRGRRVFDRAPEGLKQFGCSLLLVGISPHSNGPQPWSHVVRMRSPDFRPEFGSAFSWLSIGTGSTHETASEFANGTMSSMYPFHQGEVMNPGGTASGIATAVMTDLRESPRGDVSEFVQVGTVWRNRHEIRTMRAEWMGAWSSWKLEAPTNLATNWPEFQLVAKAAGLQAAAAST